jgi:hypothetical protein
MALYSIVFLGSTPIGAPLVGWLAELAGPRSGMYAGAAAALLAALYARVAFARAAAAAVTAPAVAEITPQRRCESGSRSRARAAGILTSTSGRRAATRLAKGLR